MVHDPGCVFFDPGPIQCHSVAANSGKIPSPGTACPIPRPTGLSHGNQPGDPRGAGGPNQLCCMSVLSACILQPLSSLQAKQFNVIVWLFVTYPLI